MYSKKDLIELVKHWSKRTKRQFGEAVEIMCSRGFKITDAQFQANFRKHPERVTEYDPYEIMTLVHAFHDGVPTKNVARAFEALLAFEWAGVPRMESALNNLFGPREMSLATEKFDQVVKDKAYTFHEYLQLLPEILGRIPVPAPGYALIPLEDSNLARQIEAAKKALWGGETLSASRILERLEKEATQLQNQGYAVPELADIHQQLGIVRSNQGRYDESQEHLQVALNIALNIGHPQTISAIYGNMGSNAFYRGNFGEAKTFYQLCYENAYHAGLTPIIVFAITALASIEMDNMNYALAVEKFTSAYTLAVQENLKERAAYAALNLSYLYMRLENDERARYYVGMGFEHIRSIEHPQLLAQLHCQSARLKVDQKDHYGGDAELALALEIAENTDNEWLLQSVRMEFAKSYLRISRDDRAIILFKDILIRGILLKNMELTVRSVYGITLTVLAKQSVFGTITTTYDIETIRREIGKNAMDHVWSLEIPVTLLEKTKAYFKQGLENFPGQLKAAADTKFTQLLLYQ